MKTFARTVAFYSAFMLAAMPAATRLQAANDQVHTIDQETGIETWSNKQHGVTFSLTQILPDQARAFYVNRGFTLEQIEPYATACIYMTVLRNEDAPGVISYVQQDWSIVSEQGTHPPMKITDWMDRLRGSGANQSAMIAFRWAQFPPKQQYEPGGDWNQGMLTTGLAPGSIFDAVARWELNGRIYENKLTGVRCAK